MDSMMTAPTYHQRFSLPGCHYLHPERLLRPSFDVQIPQGSDMVYLDITRAATQFALVSQEALFEFRSGTVDSQRGVIEYRPIITR